MQKKMTFGKWEAVCVLITMISAKAVLSYPRVMAESAGTAACLLCIYLFVLTIIAFSIISKLYSEFEGKDLIDIGESIGKKAGKIIVGVILLGFLITLTSLYLRTFSEEMKIMGLVNSPISFIELFFLLGMAVSAYFGLEAIVRFQALLVPVGIISFSIFIIALLPWVDFSNIKPILGTGASDIFIKSIPKVSAYSEIIFLPLLAPFIKTKGDFKKAGYTAIVISLLVLTAITFIYIGIYPYPSSLEGFLPAYELGRMIEYGRFFQRLESVLVITWATIGFMYLSTAFYFIIYIFRKTFDLQYQRPLIWPFAILVFNISLLPKSVITAVELDTKNFRDWSWTVVFGMTIILLIIGKYAGRDKNRSKK